MKLVDLFCGTGGFSTGAHRAGQAVSAAFDVDPVLSSSFNCNFPNTRLSHADLSKASGEDIRRFVGDEIDGVFGGPPCQGFSSIGLRDANDPRRLLLGHFFRLVLEIRPVFFIMENVVGLSQGNAKNVLEEAIDPVRRRYEIVGPIILDAADYGAATRRKRVFVIGYDAKRCDPISEENFKRFQRSPASVRDALFDLNGAKFSREDEHGFDIWKLANSTVLSDYAKRLRSKKKIFTGHRLTKHTPQVMKRFASVAQGDTDKIGRHPRLSWSGQCPTLRAGTGSDKGSYQSVRPIHPELPRVITVREGARLQGFADSHRFHPTLWHSFRMIGNSVSPILAEAIFRAIAKCCSENIGPDSSRLEAAE